MKKLAVLLAVLVTGFAVTACGSSNTQKQATPDTLAAALDQVCTDTNADFEAMGTRGLTLPAIAQEFEGTAEVRQAVIDGFKEIDANDEAQADLDEYIAASEKIVAQDKAIAKAAKDGDEAAMNAAFEAQSKAFDERDKLATELGTKVCGQKADIKVESSGTEPPADLNAVEPSNTVEEAADQYLKDGIAGDCEAINANRHTDAGELDDATCDAVQKNLVGGEVAGTESYGPVGQAEIIGNADTHLATYFVTDLDGKLRYGGDAINDNGGLRPAPEGNDSQETADALVAAIRDNDVEAFNATLPDESSAFWLKGKKIDTFGSGKYVEDFLADVRDSDQEPVQLGLNSTFGFYFLEGSKYDWVITTIHIPGVGGHYRFSGYYPLPKP